MQDGQALTASAYLCGLLVAAALTWAALAKLRHPRSTAASFESLGLPRPRLLASAVPAVELAVALLLAAVPLVGGVAAVVLLGAFSAVLARARSTLDGVSCSCFGASSTRPVGRADLARNAALGLAAAAAVARAEVVAPSTDALVLVGTAAVLAAVVVALFRLGDELGAVWRIELAGEPNP